MHYVYGFLVIAWGPGAFLSLCWSVGFAYWPFDRTRFVLSLPDSVFENGVIDHEAIRRIRQEKLEDILRREKQARLKETERCYPGV